MFHNKQPPTAWQKNTSTIAVYDKKTYYTKSDSKMHNKSITNSLQHYALTDVIYANGNPHQQNMSHQ